MGSPKKLRLGHVDGEDAVRLRETMNVEGISVEDMTKRVVSGYLSQQTAQDKARHEADTLIKILPDKTVPFRHVEGLGMCLIFEGKPVTVEDFANTIARVVEKVVKDQRGGQIAG